jgi:uncharacterized protein (TIGR02118 family)
VIRRLTLVRRNPRYTREEFAEHWLGRHARIAAELPGLRGYRINLTVERDPGVPWDGVAELWFDSVEAADAAFGEGPVAERLRRDTGELLAEWHPFFVEEHVIVEPREAAAP